MYFKQPGFTYSAKGPFTENKERIQKCKQAGDLRYIYQKKKKKSRQNMLSA